MADFRDEEEFEQNDLDNDEEKTATDGAQDAVEKERSVASTDRPAEPALEAAPEAESEYTLSDKPGAEFEPTPQSVQSEIRRTRHRKEIPLYIICIIGGVAAFIYNIISTINGGGLEKELKNLKDVMTDSGVEFGTTELNMLITIVGLFFGFGALLLLIGMILFQVYNLYAGQLSYSIRVSEKNFPELYAKVKEYTYLLGLKKEPEVYVRQMNGEINAYTSWVPGKTFIQLNAEIVDLCYMENKDFDTVYFVMAHEFGHVHLHHVQLKYMLWSAMVNFIPIVGQFILGPLLSRAREFSADRVGQALTNGVGQLTCMMMLSSGRHAYKYMDAEQYLYDIYRGHNKIERLARWCVNMTASHPIMPLRVRAIMDPQKRSGKLVKTQ